MPLIKILKEGRTLIVPERLAERLIDSSQAEFLDVVETKKEIATRHIKEKAKERERLKKDQQRQAKERQEAKKNERLAKIALLHTKED
tara:strand:+ start:16 stop:279 length:264 start_codon:yes stop_codon:yes gene_type:complete